MASEKNSNNGLWQRRRAGLLLHPTSLPGDYGRGDLGVEAYNFIDFLVASGLTVWQVLPLGPTHNDGSPYQCLSAHAGNSLLISLEWLTEQGWLDVDVVRKSMANDANAIQGIAGAFRLASLIYAGNAFFQQADADCLKRFEAFKIEQRAWLDDYALFMAVKRVRKGEGWFQWPKKLRQRAPAALKKARQQYADEIVQIQFEQFIFFTQWQDLRAYANARGVLLFGDMPIYVAYDSADVWANKENFLMDKDGECALVAGVPPDVFSEEGQRWGNPLYDWEYLQSHKFSWWKKRVKTQLALFDLVRIDHFLGLESCWQIPAEEDTAINGQWVKVPGADLLTSLSKTFAKLPLVAEDLGLITEAVEKLRKSFNLPGMKILQFAFDGEKENPYLPKNHEENSVVYSGTHDNDTTLGWYQSLDAASKQHFHAYLFEHEEGAEDMPWVMNRMALASNSRLAILPMQDILSLDSSHRMNTPGTVEGNWKWRFEWGQVWPNLSQDLRELIQKHGRG